MIAKHLDSRDSVYHLYSDSSPNPGQPQVQAIVACSTGRSHSSGQEPKRCLRARKAVVTQRREGKLSLTLAPTASQLVSWLLSICITVLAQGEQLSCVPPPRDTVSPTVQQDPNVSPGSCSCQWLPVRLQASALRNAPSDLCSHKTAGAQSCVIHSATSTMCLWEQRANSAERGGGQADSFLSSVPPACPFPALPHCAIWGQPLEKSNTDWVWCPRCCWLDPAIIAQFSFAAFKALADSATGKVLWPKGSAGAEAGLENAAGPNATGLAGV